MIYKNNVNRAKEGDVIKRVREVGFSGMSMEVRTLTHCIRYRPE